MSSESDKGPWWESIHRNRHGKTFKAVVSNCCQWPISCPRCGDGFTCEWRCTKCGKDTFKDGTLKNIEEYTPAEVEFKPELKLDGIKTFGSHGLDRKDAMAGDAYQSEMPEFDAQED